MELAKNIVSAFGICGFRAHYQPIVLRDQSNSKVVGYEALCRQVKGNRMMMGDEIISIAKNDNTLAALDTFMTMLNLAIRPQVPRDQFISINVSAKTLVNPSFISRLERQGMQKQKLVLEITETECLRREDFQVLSVNSEKIREWGWKLAIDDFGDGHSSLRYLNRMKVDIVKISRESLHDLKFSPHEGKIQFMRDLIFCLQRQKIEIILEGVETDDDLEVGKLLNVDMLQGFMFGKPTAHNIPGKLADCLAPKMRASL